MGAEEEAAGGERSAGGVLGALVTEAMGRREGWERGCAGGGGGCR